jgi:hypothetical protein
MKRRILLPVLGAMGLLIGLARPSLAKTVVQDLNVPVGDTLGNGNIIYDVCTGEFVEIDGYVHIHIESTQDRNGGFHGIFSINASDIPGVGLTTGNSYVFRGSAHDSFNAQQPFPVVETFVDRAFGLTSQGSSSNMVVPTEFHYTVNADGQVTVDFVKADGTPECRG